MQNLSRYILRFALPLIATMLGLAVGVPKEENIFEARYSCKGTPGSLRVDDLTVLGFRIGASTIKDVRRRFPGATLVKLAKGEEAETGVCIKNKDGEAAIFATENRGQTGRFLIF